MFIPSKYLFRLDFKPLTLSIISVTAAAKLYIHTPDDAPQAPLWSPLPIAAAIPFYLISCVAAARNMMAPVSACHRGVRSAGCESWDKLNADDNCCLQNTHSQITSKQWQLGIRHMRVISSLILHSKVSIECSHLYKYMIHVRLLEVNCTYIIQWSKMCDVSSNGSLH